MPHRKCSSHGRRRPNRRPVQPRSGKTRSEQVAQLSPPGPDHQQHGLVSFPEQRAGRVLGTSALTARPARGAGRVPRPCRRYSPRDLTGRPVPAQAGRDALMAFPRSRRTRSAAAVRAAPPRRPPSQGSGMASGQSTPTTTGPVLRVIHRHRLSLWVASRFSGLHRRGAPALGGKCWTRVGPRKTRVVCPCPTSRRRRAVPSAWCRPTTSPSRPRPDGGAADDQRSPTPPGPQTSAVLVRWCRIAVGRWPSSRRSVEASSLRDR